MDGFQLQTFGIGSDSSVLWTTALESIFHFRAWLKVKGFEDTIWVGI